MNSLEIKCLMPGLYHWSGLYNLYMFKVMKGEAEYFCQVVLHPVLFYLKDEDKLRYFKKYLTLSLLNLGENND